MSCLPWRGRYEPRGFRQRHARLRRLAGRHGHLRGGRGAVELLGVTESYYLIEHRLSDGTWTQLSVPIESGIADARLSLAHTWANHPDEFFRLVKCTTTTEVVAE
jgi:hypothetical protein